VRISPSCATFASKAVARIARLARALLRTATLPTLVETPPDGEGWLHEIKHGFRTQLVIDSGKAWAFSRNGHD
jgi:ATP-dependent DNA ligase